MERRAKQLPKCYRDKARNIDRLYCGAVEGHTGPVEQRLEQFGEIQCFVIGQFGEASADLHEYLSKCASSKSQRMANVLRRPPSDFEASQILQYLCRSLSVCAIQSQASCYFLVWVTQARMPMMQLLGGMQLSPGRRGSDRT